MQSNKFISLYEPQFSNKEYINIKKCIETKWLSSSGAFVKKFEKKIINYTKSKYAVACINGTSALQIALKLIDVKFSDEVIVPSITFIAPINAVKYLNASPIFLDIDNSHTINTKDFLKFIDKNTIFKNGITVNKKTKKRIIAIILVHTWGNAADIESIFNKCKERNIKIIEDASESLGTFYKTGKFKNFHTGTIGDIGCISFNVNKIITTGGGGMILTNNKNISKRANYLVTQAKDDSFRFIHNDIGYNFKMNNISAAIGCAQFETFREVLKKKKLIHHYYKNYFKKSLDFEILSPPHYSKSNYWMNVLIIKNKKIKISKLIKKLIKNYIDIRPVWYPNHLQKPFLKYQNFLTNNCNDIIKQSICLPSSPVLKKNEIIKICKIIDE